MGECEVCGKSQKILNIVKIHGTIFNACDKCSGLGTIIKKGDSSANYPQKTTFGKSYTVHKMNKELLRDVRENSDGSEIVRDDFAKIISSARQRRGLTQKEFARNINEKESMIHSIESGKHIPDLKLAKKLEKFLGVSLIEKE